MRILPIVQRELTVSARRRGTYWLRLLLAGVGIVIFGVRLWWMEALDTPASTQGQRVFREIVIVLYLFCLFAGCWATSDCISREKREGTLGLLFLTDLKGFDVVLGKLAASSLGYVYGLIGVMPFLALTVQMGGVTFAQVVYSALMLIVVLVFSLSVGIWVSTFSTYERRAMSTTLGVILVSLFLPWLLTGLMMIVVTASRGAGEIAGWMALAPSLFSPALAFGYVISMAVVPPGWLLASLGCVLFLSFVILRAASRRVPRIWQEKGVMNWQEASGRVGEVRFKAPTSSQVRRRRRLLGTNAYLWLSLRDGQKVALVWVYLIAMVVIWVSSSLSENSVMLDANVLVPGILLVHLVLKIWVVSEAAMRMVEDRGSGTLELLLTTPLADRGIRAGQWLAFLRQFGAPVGILIGLETVLLSQRLPWPVAAINALVLIADLMALHWVALWLGLVKGRTNAAILGAVVRVLAVPFVLAMGISIFIEASTAYRVGLVFDMFHQTFAVWAIVGLTADALLGFWRARVRLRSGLRAFAEGEFMSHGHH